MIIVPDAVLENIVLSLAIMAMICLQIENGKVQKMLIRETTKRTLLGNNYLIIGVFPFIFSTTKISSDSVMLGDACAL